jgi:hypothetical protein
MYSDGSVDTMLFSGSRLPSSLPPAASSMVPRVLPAQERGAVLLRAVHQLAWSAGRPRGQAAARTKNHMEAPRAVDMKR